MEPTTITTIFMISVCHRHDHLGPLLLVQRLAAEVRRYLSEEEQTGGRDPDRRTADAAGDRGLRARRATPLRQHSFSDSLAATYALSMRRAIVATVFAAAFPARTRLLWPNERPGCRHLQDRLPRRGRGGQGRHGGQQGDGGRTEEAQPVRTSSTRSRNAGWMRPSACWSPMIPRTRPATSRS